MRIGGVEYQLPAGTNRLEGLVVQRSFLGADGRLNPDPYTRTGSFNMRLAHYGPAGFGVRVAMVQGQVDERLHPTSSHVGQTTADLAALRLRRVWLERTEIEENLCPFVDEPDHEHEARRLMTAL